MNSIQGNKMKTIIMNWIHRSRLEYQFEMLFGNDFRQNCKRKR